jgi:hypothetical protein
MEMYHLKYTINNMLRELKIYHSTDIGNHNVIHLNKKINKYYDNLTISPQSDGNILYSSGEEKLFIQDVEQKIIFVTHDSIWIIFSEYNLRYPQICDIVSYILHLKYAIKGYNVMTALTERNIKIRLMLQAYEIKNIEEYRKHKLKANADKSKYSNN